MTIDKTTMTTILVVNKTAAISRSPISHLTEFLAIRIASLTCAYSVTDYRLLEFRNFLLGGPDLTADSTIFELWMDL